MRQVIFHCVPILSIKKKTFDELNYKYSSEVTVLCIQSLKQKRKPLEVIRSRPPTGVTEYGLRVDIIMYTHQPNFSDGNATQYMPKSRLLLLLDYLPDLYLCPLSLHLGEGEQDND